jgi:predicted nucleic acid-binding protein
MDYCLDTSVYTQAYRSYYAFDIAPPFWRALITLAENEITTSPIAVYDELMIGKEKDELKYWAKDHRKILFVEPDSKVNEAYRQVVEFANNRYRDQHQIREFLKGADPWVVAHAKAHSLIVVTMEGFKQAENVDKVTGRFIGKIKIPNMCDHFGIKSIPTYELLRTLKIELK